jgi:wyosine [tRNA(Phe)-imidazoG37] synthetase (radical SAM superfamily)
VIAFGPAPSRRLGRSLGVNNLPAPKHCTYSCVYCQVGATRGAEVRRGVFHAPGEVVRAVAQRLARCRAAGESVDYVTFVPNGEPTLDVNLGEEIRRLKRLGLPVAVITNGSLLWRAEVRAELAAADLVSVKVDAVTDTAWRRVNGPAPDLSVDSVLTGILDFARAYHGELISETMVLSGFNDDEATVGGVAAFLQQVRPRCAYLAVPLRPPANPRARPPVDEVVVRAYAILREHLPRVELLTGEESGSFGHGGDPAEDLMGILAVHPMRERAAREYLAEAHAGWEVAEALLASGRMMSVEYRGERFVARRRPERREA